METQGHNHKRFLLACILLVLFLPLIQEYTRMVPEKMLKGAYLDHNKPKFSSKAWFSGDYQQQYEDWVRDDFGFRHSLVRLHNQVVYSLFRQAGGFGIVAGKDGCLYEENYIKAYEGWDYLGDTTIRTTLAKVKALQDTLAKKNVTLIVGLAPGKASYYSEYIPDWWGPPKKNNNYRTFAKYLNQLNINHIDYNKWFLEMKPKTKYPLYSKIGIHWSRYGADLALDSLIKYIEHKRSIDMPSFIVKHTYLDDSLHYPDNDIGQTTNLIWPIKSPPMAYNDFGWEDTTGRTRPRMLAVGDSYFWQLYDKGISPESFSFIDFYYYNENVYFSDDRTPVPVEEMNGPLDCEKTDVVFLLCTEANLASFGWGFVNEAYDYQVLKKPVSMGRLVRSYERAIRLDKTWLMSVQRKADERKIPLDSMIHLDAAYMAREDSLNYLKRPK